MPALDLKQAQNVIDDVRAQHGLGQRYAITLEAAGPSRWRVVDTAGKTTEVGAMDAEAWRQWLERFFIEAITEHDKTTEG